MYREAYVLFEQEMLRFSMMLF